MEINLMPKNACFYCETCNFKCNKKSNWIIHNNTKKHIYRVNGNPLENAETNKNAEKVCNCGKKFLTKSGLWKHSKVCKINEIHIDVSNNKKEDKDDLINYLIKENQEFKNLILEIVKKDSYNQITNNSHNTTNSHNKAFNLNFFLNETCKDAMNIMDFVESIQLQVSDLERVGEVGYVEGISDIIVSNLNKLDITQRPIHCTDKKRETMYIKDAGKWEKDETTNLIRRAIRKVTHNNQRLLPQFKEKYPDYHNSYSSHSDKVTKVVIETMVNNVPEKEEKIIRNIAKNVVLDKTHSL